MNSSDVCSICNTWVSRAHSAQEACESMEDVGKRPVHTEDRYVDILKALDSKTLTQKEVVVAIAGNHGVDSIDSDDDGDYSTVSESLSKSRVGAKLYLMNCASEKGGKKAEWFLDDVSVSAIRNCKKYILTNLTTKGRKSVVTNKTRMLGIQDIGEMSTTFVQTFGGITKTFTNGESVVDFFLMKDVKSEDIEIEPDQQFHESPKQEHETKKEHEERKKIELALRKAESHTVNILKLLYTASFKGKPGDDDRDALIIADNDFIQSVVHAIIRKTPGSASDLSEYNRKFILPFGGCVELDIVWAFGDSPVKRDFVPVLSSSITKPGRSAPSPSIRLITTKQLYK